MFCPGKSDSSRDGHWPLVKTGKAVPNVQDKTTSQSCKSHLRAGDAMHFFDGYVHDVAVHGDKGHVFAKPECWASREKQ